MDPRSTSRNVSLSVLACASLGGAIAALLGGPAMGLLGLLLGASAGGLVAIPIAVRNAAREPAPAAIADVEPERALAILAAMQGRSPDALSSPLLRELEQIRELARDDSERALARVAELASRHPRSAPVHATWAILQLGRGREDEAARAGSTAIVLALHTGANPAAARTLLELRSIADRLVLAPVELVRLGGALDALGEADLAGWCRTRAESPATAHDPENQGARAPVGPQAPV